MVPGVSHFNGDGEEMEGEEILTIPGVPPSHSALHLLLVPAHEWSAESLFPINHLPAHGTSQ